VVVRVSEHLEMSRGPASRALLSAVIGLAAPGAFLAFWYRLVENVRCESTAMFACTGRPAAMIVIGLPLCYVVWSVGLRLAGVGHPWLAPLAIALGLVLLVPLSAPLGVPNWCWVAVATAASAAWGWFFDRRALSSPAGSSRSPGTP
jgi:hypothetical protein